MENINLLLSILFFTALIIIVILLIKLRQKNQLLISYDRVMKLTNESIFLIDSNKKILSIINGIPELFAGYTLDQIVGENVDTFVKDTKSTVNQGATLLSRNIDKVRATGDVGFFRYKVQNVDFEAFVSQTEEGNFMFVVRDIRTIIARENEIRKEKESEVYIAMVAGGISSWSYDTETNCINSATTNEFMTADSTYSELCEKVHPEDCFRMDTALMRLVAKESTHENYVVRARGISGEYRHVNIHAVPSEYAKDGSLKTIIGSLKDITDSVNRTSEIIMLRDKAEEANRVKDTFLINISHEVRTPLNAIIGFCNLIVGDPQNEDVSQYTKVISKNSELLLKIINDVLDISSIESKNKSFTYSKFNILAFVTELVNGLKFGSEENNIKITIDDIDPNLMIDSDGGHITQVLQNLISNAVKFTPKGEINIGCVRQDNNFYFYVTDTGIGIPEEFLSKVFVRFAKLNNFSQGTGLGLSICEMIVKILGGEIGVESKVGNGSKFWFTIPIKEV